MGEVSKDILTLLTQLLPGFLTAWVVYGLTNYTKPGQFERVVQALIYSFVVNALVVVVESALLFIGKFASAGTWDHSSELITSALLAFALGLVISFFSRTDAFFNLARRLHLTSRTPYPSEWYSAFVAQPARYVVLHLTGARRLSGYPREWPTDPPAGYFWLERAAWINNRGKETTLDQDDSILIPAKDVEMVEFLKNVEELSNGKATTESHPTAAQTSASPG